MIVLWCDGAHAPDENMRRDAALLASAEEDPARAPVLRLFRFAPHGITLGHAQDPARELDLERCRAEGVPWAVRPTGGRAIFHAQEWTCSLCATIADPDWGGGPAAAYARGARLIAESLQRLGVPARLAPGARGSAGFPRRGVAAPCFASTARHEIVIEGRKLVGTAQRRGARAFLQQSSILLGPGHLRLADYLAAPEVARARVRESLAASATDAGAWVGGEAPLENWADALAGLLPDAERVAGDAGRVRLLRPRG
jgi:lipoate-protein ligase A